MSQVADSKNNKNKSKSLVTNYYPNPLSQFVATVKENKEIFTKRDIERANAARKLQECIRWPRIQTFKSYINNNLLFNFSTTADDIDVALKIYGVPIPLLQGKMIRKDATTPQEYVRVPLPP